ncbi:NMD3 family-domain-containing protein [Tribonema minus]|uniref:60S ribosomal export protein NMD3 n=1 Tax=Tribonema minus TaxID=303371 RepID=A0A836CPD6_9STRA|nr:NMD3 family-domain-containing protein [Tribonema minus]
MATAHLGAILCCLCGKSIQPNSAALCGECLRAEVDITENIQEKGLKVYQCRKCLRWQGKNDHYVPCQLESLELLALCLKRIPGLSKADIVDAAFVWTEPHSMRIKVKLTLKRDVLNGVMLQQEKVVEFVVQWRQCSDCNREFTNQTWKAVVQVRQRVDHKRTFFYLEQLILAANAQHRAVDIRSLKDGMDFFFAERAHALQFADWLAGVVPQRSTKSKKLVSVDNHSNISNEQLSLRVDIVPLCKGDLVVVPAGGGKGGGAAHLAGCVSLVANVTSVVQLLDPTTLRSAELTPDRFWRSPLTPLASASSLIEFTVLDVEPVRGAGVTAATAAAAGGACVLAEAEVARSADLGANDDTFTVTTHLGHLLQAGDTVMGYDLRGANFNDAALVGLRGDLPDVVLVRKARNREGRRHHKRRVRSLAPAADGGEGGGKKGGRGGDDAGGDAEAAQYEDFMREVEEDEEMMQQLGMTAASAANAADDGDGEGGDGDELAAGVQAIALDAADDGGGGTAALSSEAL